MLKKIFLILFCFVFFSFPCFAFDFPGTDEVPPLSNDIDRDYLFFINPYGSINCWVLPPAGTYTIEGGTYLKISDADGKGLLDLFSLNGDTWSKKESVALSFRVTSGPFYTSSDYVANFLSNLGGEVVYTGGGGSDVPPNSAPTVDYNLTTESVLSVILQLIPTILVFLVLYWGFWKGYSMLLRVLGKA